MKQTVFLLIHVFFFLQSFFISAQKPTVLGINFNLNWYELTNYSAKTYWEQDEGASAHGYDENLAWVIVDFPYSENQIDDRILALDLNEKYIGFPKGHQNDLRNLNPDLFLFTKIYNPNERFYEKSVSDRRLIEKILSKELGKETILFDDENAFAAKWENQIGTSFLTCRFDDHEIILIYLIKSSEKILSLDKNGRVIFN